MSTVHETRYLSKTVEQLKPSGIRRFFDLARTMENVVSLGVGEPDFVTPWHMIEASYHSLEEGYTGYTPNAGLLELRQAISSYLHASFGIPYNPEGELIVTVGASQGIDIALRALINPGDEVIVVEPTFVSYAPVVTLAGGVAVPVQTKPENGFKLQPEELEEAITPRTKAMVLCNPNNPTGALMGKEELQRIASVVRENDLIVISDEIYAELTYDGPYASFASLDGMKERTLLISGFSKAFAMTGWRLGYVAGPEEIVNAMLKIHQYTVMSAPTMAQYAAIEGLNHGRKSVQEMRRSYQQRRNYIVKAFREMGLTCEMPGGAFYVFPSIEKTGLSSEAFAEQLLLKEKVAVVPGSVFGAGGEGHIRCSYATSLDQLKEAMRRIERFLKKMGCI